jgi:hypothetical protein
MSGVDGIRQRSGAFSPFFDERSPRLFAASGGGKVQANI